MGLSLALFNDITNRRLVRGFLEPAAFILPELSDQDEIFVSLSLYKLNPGGGPQAPFSVVSPSGISPTLVIGTMSSAGAIVEFANVTLTDISGDTFTGSVSLNTANMATAMTNTTRVEAIFCVFLVDADGQELTFQGPCVIKKSLYRNGAPSSTPGATYLTADQIAAIYARQVGLPGQTITLIDSTNTYGRIIGVNTDSSAMDDSYTI